MNVNPMALLASLQALALGANQRIFDRDVLGVSRGRSGRRIKHTREWHRKRKLTRRAARSVAHESRRRNRL